MAPHLAQPTGLYQHDNEAAVLTTFLPENDLSQKKLPEFSELVLLHNPSIPWTAALGRRLAG